MLHNFISNILVITKTVFAGEIVNNRLNPIHLAIAITGYRIQSRTLYIPDQIGFFSSGPPRLQVHEAAVFIFLIIGSCISIILGGFIVFFVKLYELPNPLKLGAVMLSVIVIQIIIVWVSVCCDRRRTPGYDWEDWKLQKN